MRSRSVGTVTVQEQGLSYDRFEMKMHVITSADGASDILILLTEREAEDLARALQLRLEGATGHHGPGYHLHIEDGEGSELTIGVLDAE